MNNQRGGILSKLFVIPAGVALMVGFFFLGYYVGKYQSKLGVQSEVMPPLPEVLSKNLPKQEEFTFYKTLTDKENKTVSIDLKARPPDGDKKAENKQAAAASANADVAQQKQKEKQPETKDTSPQPPLSHAPPKQPQTQAKNEPPAATSSNSRLRYTIQIASYQEKEMAEDDVKKFKKRGYAAFVASSELPGKGMWHRVRLGSFTSKASAEKLRKELHEKEGISPIIVIE